MKLSFTELNSAQLYKARAVCGLKFTSMGIGERPL